MLVPSSVDGLTSPGCDLFPDVATGDSEKQSNSEIGWINERNQIFRHMARPRVLCVQAARFQPLN